ncbi:MAG: TRAP transporter small permease [Desulfuromusa sp.]|nr:TRAP transporter small permease [Desulfuromusa sp.]
MERLLRGIDACSKLGAYLSSLAMLSIVGLILLEIVLRTFFSTSTLISDEYSGYLMVTVIMMGLGYTFAEGSHIRITIIAERLQGRVAQGLDLIVTLAALALCSYVLYHSLWMVQDTFSYKILADSISETPLYIPQVMIPVGFLLLELQLVAHFLRRLLSSPTP